MQVTRITGEVRLVLIHVEVQNQRDPNFAQRMYVYHYRIADYYQKPVCNLAILGDASPVWRPDTYEHHIWGCRFWFRFPMAKLEDWRSRLREVEGRRNPFGPLVAAHLRSRDSGPDSDSRRQSKFRMIRQLLTGGLSGGEVRNLVHLVDWILHLSPRQSGLFIEQMEEYEKENNVAYINTFERVALERGLKEGLERGREEGLEQGAGALQAAVRDILISRFDQVPSDLPLSDVRDLKRLGRLAVMASEVSSLDEFRDRFGSP